MRAKLILENINFERGIDPRDAMDIGLPAVRAASKMIPGVIYLSNVSRWDYQWWYPPSLFKLNTL